jgi:CheY-like chemotaxis protein
VIRVLVADDQALVRAGFVKLLESEDDMQVVGEAGDGSEAIDRAAATRPDVVLMDIRMPQVDGIEATRRVRAQPHAPRVVILTTFDLDEYVFDAIKARRERLSPEGRPRRSACRRRAPGCIRRGAPRPFHYAPADRGVRTTSSPACR